MSGVPRCPICDRQMVRVIGRLYRCPVHLVQAGKKVPDKEEVIVPELKATPQVQEQPDSMILNPADPYYGLTQGEKARFIKWLAKTYEADERMYLTADKRTREDLVSMFKTGRA